MNDDAILGVKELYDIVLKAYADTIINGKGYKKGEVLARFEKIQVANITQNKDFISARGGKGNRELVTWDETKNISIVFSQGVFSLSQLSILTNCNMIDSIEDTFQVPIYEQKESQEDGTIKLKYTPIPNSVFIYNIKTGEKIQEYLLEEKTITLQQPYLEVMIDYEFEYKSPIKQFNIGKTFTNGFLRLEGKTRLKDDETGKLVTGLLIFPKIKLKSGLSMQLGQSTNPMVSTFYGEATPEGIRGQKIIANLYVLSDNIDSDF